MAKFEIKKRSNGEFHFNLLADNHKVILTSEGYKSKDGCKKGIESVRRNSSEDSRYERDNSADGKYYFKLKAANGEVIGVSEMYNTMGTMENGIKSVKDLASGADIDDRAAE